MQNFILKILNKSVLGILLLLSIYFFLERTTVLDASFQGSLIYLEENFAIQVERFGAVFVQLFPLVGVKLGLPLKWTLILYSMSFVLEAWLVYWILSSRLKLEGMATAITIYLTVFVGHTFFWAQSELLQANVLVLLYGGLLYKWREELVWWQVAVLGVFAVVLTYLHPLAFIPLFFVIGFAWLSMHNKWQLTYYVSAVLAILAWVWKQFIMKRNFYDKRHISYADNVTDKIGDFFSLESTANFVDFCIKDYYLFLPLVAIAVVYYIRQKKWLKLLWFIAFLSGILVLINCSYYWGMKQFHVESFYRTMVVVLGVVIGVDVLQDQQWRRWMIGGVLPLVFALRLVAIWNKAPEYTARVEYNKQLIEAAKKYNGQKFILKEQDAPQPVPHNYWSVVYETAVLSAMEGRDSVVSVFIAANDDKRIENTAQLPPAFLDAFQIEGRKAQSRYFNFDPQTPYIYMSRKDFE